MNQVNARYEPPVPLPQVVEESGGGMDREARHHLASTLLLVEIVSRAMKNVLRAYMRSQAQCGDPSEHAMVALACRFVNLMCGDGSADTPFPLADRGPCNLRFFFGGDLGSPTP